MRLAKRVYIGAVLFFLYSPIAILISYSFNQSKSRGHWCGLTLQWYRELFSDVVIMSSLKYTLLLATFATLTSVVLGTFAAYVIHGMKKQSKAVVINITYLPILNSDIVTGVSLMLLFLFLKIPFGFWTMLLAHITFGVPYVTLSVLYKLKQLGTASYEAALDLGAGPSYAFFHIILPRIMPSVINGALIAFTMSVDDFVISFFTAGAGVSNLSMLAYSMARRGVKPSLNALSALMFVATLLLLLLINLRTTEKNKALP